MNKVGSRKKNDTSFMANFCVYERARTCLWHVTTVAALRATFGSVVTLMAWDVLLVPVPPASPSRGPEWLATAPCAESLPNDADTAHGVQFFDMTVLYQ